MDWCCFPCILELLHFNRKKPSPDLLLKAIQDFKITICFTAPTAWRIITTKVQDYDISSLRKCVSAGETFAVESLARLYDVTGLKSLTESVLPKCCIFFISSNEENMKPGTR